ncbi:MAG: glycyl-radical enzyme activating protein [Desulfurococcaceae archaeon]
MKRGIIFDIQRFAIYDGPGIRTLIFLKGCPLRCWWCQNPEGLDPKPIVVHYDYKCMRCQTCVRVCPEKAVIYDESKNCIIIDRDLCKACGICVKACPTTAMRLIGRSVSTDEVLSEIERDIPFYDSSGGGVTFSGGEPLFQPEFLLELLRGCKARGIHVAIETSGFTSSNIFKKIIKYTDLLLYDIKLVDEQDHLKYTGVSNKQILLNLHHADNVGKEIIIRFPVIPSITDTERNLEGLLNVLSNLKNVKRVDLLPYHDVKEKYERLGMEYKMKPGLKVSDERLFFIKQLIEERGYKVTIGGYG